MIENQLLLAALDKLRRLGRLPDQLQHDLLETHPNVRRRDPAALPAPDRSTADHQPPQQPLRTRAHPRPFDPDERNSRTRHRQSKQQRGAVRYGQRVRDVRSHSTTKSSDCPNRVSPRGHPPGGLYLDHARHVPPRTRHLMVEPRALVTETSSTMHDHRRRQQRRPFRSLRMPRLLKFRQRHAHLPAPRQKRQASKRPTGPRSTSRPSTRR